MEAANHVSIVIGNVLKGSRLHVKGEGGGHLLGEAAQLHGCRQRQIPIQVCCLSNGEGAVHREVVAALHAARQGHGAGNRLGRQPCLMRRPCLVCGKDGLPGGQYAERQRGANDRGTANWRVPPEGRPKPLVRSLFAAAFRLSS